MTRTPAIAPPGAGHWELVRALGAAVLTAAPDNRHLFAALDLPAPSRADCTDTFVLSLPPHAAIYLGAEGKLGGEGLDRIAGCWRVLGLTPPADADHLGGLLMLYASLGEGASAAPGQLARDRLGAAAAGVLTEHIWSWAPGYLAAVAAQSSAGIGAWARLTGDVLAGELARTVTGRSLPLALRAAPAPLTPDAAMADVLNSAVAPIRSGMILTFSDLALCAAAIGAGLRRGERRYALRYLLEQDAHATLAELAEHAARWSRLHAGHADQTSTWWSERARGTSRVLATMAERRLDDVPSSPSSSPSPSPPPSP